MSEPDITRLLRQAADGDDDAFAGVVQWAYGELERLAAQRLRSRYGRDADALTLEPAAVVNETFIRLLRHPLGFDNRQHFLGFLSRVMLRVLIDYERARGADKRGGAAIRVTLSGQEGAPDEQFAITDLATALDELDRLDPRKGSVAKLRLIWGFELGEIGDLVEVSLPTAERDWRFARNWLAVRLGGEL